MIRFQSCSTEDSSPGNKRCRVLRFDGKKAFAFHATFLLTVFYCLLPVFNTGVFGDQSSGVSPSEGLETENMVSVDGIVDRLESKYSGAGFKARFDQLSTIKALDVQDTAYGNVTIQYPGKMRWEYEAPEKQLIVSNGETIWIYRSEDRQVTIGDATAFFGDGKGASFLSDIRLIRREFNVFLEPREGPTFVLKMIPKDDRYEVSVIYLEIDKSDYTVSEIVTYNNYGDETRIILSGYEFNIEPGDDLFQFVIPYGVDILQMD